MPRRFYLRPVGFVAADPGHFMPDAPHPAEPIAGRKDLEFTHFELIERTDTGTRRRLIPAAGPLGFDGQDLFHPPFDGDQMWADFAAVRAARPPIAGLSLDRPRLMGIVNVTPDSFSDGGRHDNAEAAIAHGLKLAEEGAEILDIGGESTRPGSDTVAVDDELRRVIPVIEGLRAKTDRLISIDTRKAEVMRRAVAAGADILNDVSALTHDPRSLEVAAESGLPVMLMHAQGDPKTMNDNPHYTDVTLDVFDFLEQRIRDCVAAGIPKSRLIADPGIGFGKHLHHNVAVLNAMSLYHGLGVPVLLGASRKKIIGQLCNVESPGDRVPGSIAAALHSIAQGVQIVRVHDVAETRQAIAVWEAAQAGSEDRALG